MKNEITVGENGYFDQLNRLSEERLDLRKYKPILTNYQVQLQTNPTSSSLNEDKNWYLAQINNLWGPLICGGPGHVPCWPAPKSGPVEYYNRKFFTYRENFLLESCTHLKWLDLQHIRH